MKALILMAVLLAGPAQARGISTCDTGPFPDMPASIPADVIAVGRVEKVTETLDAKGLGKGSAEVAIQRVAVGDLAVKTHRLDYPVATDADPCVFGTGPELRLGQSVALYFMRVSGELKVVDWFFADQAVLADPRLATMKPRP